MVMNYLIIFLIYFSQDEKNETSDLQIRIKEKKYLYSLTKTPLPLKTEINQGKLKQKLKNVFLSLKKKKN
jgi:hypothetical protein